MKNLTYPPILTICVIVLISPLFFSLESVNLAKPTFKERVLEQVKAGKKIAVFTVLSPIGYEHTSGKKSKLCDEVANGSITDKSSSAGSKYIYSAVFAGELVPVDYEDDRIAFDGINKAEKLILEKGCYDVVGTWESDPSFIQYQDIFKADGTAISTHTNVRTQAKKKYDGIWECLDAEKRIFLYKDNEHFDSKYQIKDGKLCDLGISKICSKRKK